MQKRQPLTAKIGEIQFRAQIASQHLGTKRLFSQEYSPKEMQNTLLERAQNVFTDFQNLRKRGILFSPFLEIGSEYGQAALVLVNQFGATGFATDLARGPLAKLAITARRLRQHHLPVPLVCDAELLPFPNNSFPFVFCYQTLHHFPHPGRVIQEAYRVLAPGGYFFFAEEPVAQTMNIPLWRRPTKLRWWEKVLKATLILPFISRIGKTETEHGILEETFSLSVWKQALAPFENVEAKLFPFPFGPTGNLRMAHGVWHMETLLDRLNRFFIFFTGGGINGLARKKGILHNQQTTLPPLSCVNCTRHTKLTRRSGKLRCPTCHSLYLKKDGIDIVLLKKLQEKLYP